MGANLKNTLSIHKKQIQIGLQTDTYISDIFGKIISIATSLLKQHKMFVW